MKIFLIGVGAVGSVIAKLLVDDDEISQVVCGSRRIDRAKESLNLRHKKLKFVELDASDENAIVKKAKGANVIINASLPTLNETIMRAALRVGSHYEDLASDLDDLITAEQLAYDDDFKKAGLKALINAGVAPGVSNLLAREAADELDEVKEIHFRCIEDREASEFVFTWSVTTMLDELASPPLVYKNGKFGFTKQFEDKEEYQFPSPFGKRTSYSLYGDEVATVPLFIKTDSVDFKCAGSDIELSKILSHIGLFGKEPVDVKGKKVVPVEFFDKIAPPVPSPKEMRRLLDEGIIENGVLVVTVEAVGKKNGKKARVKLSAIFPDLKKIRKVFPGATYIAYPTGAAAYCFMKIIPKIKQTGVFPPETLEAGIRKEILKNLKKHHVKIVRE